jgi:two-component system, cell cycle response regulator
MKGEKETAIIKLVSTDEIRKKLPVLVVISGNILDIGRMFKVDENAQIIGRDPACDIALNDDQVSRKHLKVSNLRIDGRIVEIMLEDLGSTNGTTLNGKKIKTSACHLEETIGIGESIMIFRMEEAGQLDASPSILSLVSRDSLTNLYNRRAFENQLSRVHEQARLNRKHYSIITIDIDHFKKINDTLGHPTGDRVLKKFSDFLVNHTRGTDIVARIGGEEFAIIMQNTDRAVLVQAGTRLRIEAELLDLSEIDPGLSISISIGAAQFAGNEETWEEIFGYADASLLRAKNTGRNQFIVWPDRTPESSD